MDQAASDRATLVLIAEDEPDNREIMRTVAEEILGCRVILASDGETAVKLAGELQPAVILMDLMMPVLDGFEAIQRLKSDERTAAIPSPTSARVRAAKRCSQRCVSGVTAMSPYPEYANGAYSVFFPEWS